MFTHLVLLNKSPWFVYAADEIDALRYVGQFRDNCVGVAVSSGGFEVKQPISEIKLTQNKQELIDLDPTKSKEPEMDPKAAEQAVDAALEKSLDDVEDPTPKV